ncbi:hypothetical protein [Fulvivirga lutea]|uniref:TerB family tellurite resistance protein n=1 Tax=Fulvivirga lutea TaxID=2810512 RepID=A0A974WEH8_9BACT|nr:hypothetical protein [Fulvivirga lutea]QSE96868.1 hypothetical protein JR347_14900 [Fulvivirga lutea]
MNLAKEELQSIKLSFFNILALFLSQEKIESKYVGCLLKWSAQLGLSQKDLHKIEGEFDKMQFQMLDNRIEKMEAIYHLVHMIYLDNIVEDIELEVAAVYAEKLGFKPEIVGELFKAIATAAFDGSNPAAVKQNVEEFLQLHDVD